MQGLNKIFLLGRLGNDPQIYSTSTGRPYTGLSLATQRTTNIEGEDGKTKDTTDWHYVRVWGKQAENCAKYLTKGQPVLVEGYLSHYTQAREREEYHSATESSTDASTTIKSTGSTAKGGGRSLNERKQDKKITITALRVDFLPRAKMSEQGN